MQMNIKFPVGALVQYDESGLVCCISTAQEILESLKDRWFQADNPPADQLLNEEEFLSFLHPEHSRGMLKYMVKEIIRDLGRHGSSLSHLCDFQFQNTCSFVYLMTCQCK